MTLSRRPEFSIINNNHTYNNGSDASMYRKYRYVLLISNYRYIELYRIARAPLDRYFSVHRHAQIIK